MIDSYVLLGSQNSGRRGVIANCIEMALSESNIAILISESEIESESEKNISKFPNAKILKYKDTQDAKEKFLSLSADDIEFVFYVADSNQNVIDELEFLKNLNESNIIRIVRIWALVDCKLFLDNFEKMSPYYDALSHFCDCMLLSNRADLKGSQIEEILKRYKKLCHPHLIVYVKKDFKCDNPAILLVDEARRITMAFDAYDPVDELDLDEDNLPEEPFDLSKKEDPYFVRFENGMRSKTVPLINTFLK